MKRLALVILGAALLSSSFTPLHHVGVAQARDSSLVVEISSATKVLDLGPKDFVIPAGWSAANLDDSLWEHAVKVASDTAQEIHTRYGSLANLPLYWGPNPNDRYCFRMTFFLPEATSYQNSSVTVVAQTDETGGAVNNSGTFGTSSSSGDAYSLNSYPISQYLHAGKNAVGIATNSFSSLRAISVHVSIHIQGATLRAPVAGTPRSKVSSVSLSFPANNAIVTGSSLPLAWTPFPNATSYLLRVTLVKPDLGEAIRAHTVTAIERTVVGTRVNVATANLLKGVYQWAVAAVNANGMIIAV